MTERHKGFNPDVRAALTREDGGGREYKTDGRRDLENPKIVAVNDEVRAKLAKDGKLTLESDIDEDFLVRGLLRLTLSNRIQVVSKGWELLFKLKGFGVSQDPLVTETEEEDLQVKIDQYLGKR